METSIKQGTVVRKNFNYGSHKVIPVSHNLVDFFWGIGWTNIARFKWNGKEWELWNKSSALPKDFLNSLEQYRKER
jgi:hypothetical protein